jgi:EAL domain-containing protein (putative c-di-GMP-specific phosphodiesterase class I)
MPRTSYGDEKQQQSWTLLESILIGGSESTPYSSDSSGVKITFQGQEGDDNLQVIVKGTLPELSKLTKSRLNTTQIRDSLNEYLSDKFLNISTDLRIQKSGIGGGERHFTIKIWSLDINENKEEFNRLWKSKKPGNSTVAIREESRTRRAVNYSKSRFFELDPMENFLEPYISLVDEFVEEIVSRSSMRELNGVNSVDHRIHSLLLEVIESVTEAAAVLVCKYEKLSDRAYVDPLAPNKKTEFIDILEFDILPNIGRKTIFHNDSHGRILKYENLTYLFVPLGYQSQSSNSLQVSNFLVLCDVSTETSANILGEPAGKIISTIYSLDQASIQDHDSVEIQIFDSLKRSFKFVPFDIYERRFDSFKKQLQRMIVYFQPIVESKKFRIESWEALARDPDTKRAPKALFETAELWGVQFMTELDLHFLTKAVDTYRDQLTALKLQRGNDMLPLAVNVYPDSLMRDNYLEKVLDIIKSGKISSGNLTLEISEKFALPSAAFWDEAKTNEARFIKQLRKYSHSGSQVKFAIDDFGVGHASVSRLIELQLNYIKIDSAILNYPEEIRDKIVGFVHGILVDSFLNGFKIILEGVEKDYPVRGNHVANIETSIQGFAVDEAVENIYERISPERYNALNQMYGRPEVV